MLSKKEIEKQESGSRACPGVDLWLNLHCRKINIGRRGDHNPSCVLIPRLSNFLKKQAIKTLEENKVETNGLFGEGGGENFNLSGM